MSLCVSKRGVPPTEFSGWRKLYAGSLARNCWVQENDAGFICSSFRPPKSEQFKKRLLHLKSVAFLCLFRTSVTRVPGLPLLCLFGLAKRKPGDSGL